MASEREINLIPMTNPCILLAGATENTEIWSNLSRHVVWPLTKNRGLLWLGCWGGQSKFILALGSPALNSTVYVEQIRPEHPLSVDAVDIICSATEVVLWNSCYVPRASALHDAVQDNFIHHLK